MDTVKIMRDWAEKTDLINTLKLSDGFSVWWMMDQWLHKSRGYYNTFDDVINKIKRKPSKKIYLTKYFFRLRFWLRRLACFNFPVVKGKKTLFINSIKWDGTRDLFFNPVMKYFNNSCLVDYPTDYAAYWSIKRIFEKRKLGNNLILEMFYDSSYKKEVTMIQQRYNKIVNDSFLKNSKGIWPEIKPQMDFYIHNRMESHIRNYMALKKMVSIEKPEALIFGGEGGLYGNMCSYIGKLYNIPSIGIMHGSLNYDAKLVHYNDGCPKATKICVWGSYFKSWMMKYSDYDATDIDVIGNIRMDSFERYDKDKICLEFGLDSKQPIIIVLDQNEIDLRDVANECNELYQTIIALHPARIDKKYYNIKTVVSTEDYLKVLSVCDLVVTFGSTGVLDSMFYNKPIMLVPVKDDYWDARVLTDYYSEGIGVVCEENYNYFEKIELALTDPLKDKREVYIERHLYKIDGKATKRFANVIKDAISKV